MSASANIDPNVAAGHAARDEMLRQLASGGVQSLDPLPPTVGIPRQNGQSRPGADVHPHADGALGTAVGTLGTPAVPNGQGSDLRKQPVGTLGAHTVPVPKGDGAASPRPTRRARVTWAADIEPELIVWAWEADGHGRLPAGALALAAGREGTGKSSY